MAADDVDLYSDDTLDKSELKGTAYELFIAFLSILSIVNILLILVMQDTSLDTVVMAMNVLLSIIFLGDFVYRLATADSKRTYFLRRAGWADLLASMPIPHLKLLRLFRLIRVKKLMDREGGARMLRSLIADRAESAFLTLLLLGILVLEFGSLSMLRIEEKAAQSNIHTASDAIWYVIVTISTVGYGDRFPVTTSGRILGAVIIVIGVGIFGTFTGFLANLFLTPRKRPLIGAVDDATAVDSPADQISQLRDLLSQQQATINELERILNSQP